MTSTHYPIRREKGPHVETVDLAIGNNADTWKLSITTPSDCTARTHGSKRRKL